MRALVEQIHTTLKRSICQGWDRTFLSSILGQMEDNVSLTPRQHDTLHKVLDRNTQREQSKHAEWAHLYSEKYKDTAIILAHYHVKQHYFFEVSRSILNDEVPPRRKYMRMHNNKYSQKALREYEKPPRLEMGTYVMPRASFNSFKNIKWDFGGDYEDERKTVHRFVQHGAFIVGVEKYIISAARGATQYRLLAPGARRVFIVEERFLKRVKG